MLSLRPIMQDGHFYEMPVKVFGEGSFEALNGLQLTYVVKYTSGILNRGRL